MLLTQISWTSLCGCLVEHLCFIISFAFSCFHPSSIIYKCYLFILKLNDNWFVNYNTIMLKIVWILWCLLTSFIEIIVLMLIFGLLGLIILLLLMILFVVYIVSLVIDFAFIVLTKDSLFFCILVFERIGSNECLVLEIWLLQFRAIHEALRLVVHHYFVQVTRLVSFKRLSLVKCFTRCHIKLTIIFVFSLVSCYARYLLVKHGLQILILAHQYALVSFPLN
jgi:hypothetical protein